RSSDLELRERPRIRVELDVDAVGDDLVVAREVRRDEVSRGARDADLGVELVHVAVERDATGPVRDGEPTESVEGRDVGTLRGVEDLERQERNERLVMVDHVELFA